MTSFTSRPPRRHAKNGALLGLALWAGVAAAADIDFVNQVALVVVANDNGEPTIVGGGRYVVVQPGQAEVAFAIIDAYQGLALQLHILATSESMDHHDSEIMDDGRIDRGDA